MKKIIVVMVCAALSLVMSLPSFALDLTPEAAGKIHKAATAYSPDTFNEILEANGLSLKADAVSSIPASYAKVSDGNIVFGKKSTAYRPNELHAIFTAYGLKLSPEDVKAKLGSTNYAKVGKDGTIVFGKNPAAYNKEALTSILSAYVLPAPPVVKVTPTPTPSASPAPMPTPTPTPSRTPAAPATPPDDDNDGVYDDKDMCLGTPRGAEVDSRGCWVLPSYLFGFDKTNPKAVDHATLDKIANVLKDPANVTARFEIQGHTDSVGPNAYNQKLSEKRATTILNYLIERGVESSRLTIKGFGETSPAYTNATREGREKNRRVELKPLWR